MAPVLVFGASGAIGGATARALHGAGAAVHLAGRNGDALRARSAELGGAPVSICDVTDDEALAATVAAAAPGGALSGLVFAVGSIPLAPLRRPSRLTLREAFELNSVSAAMAGFAGVISSIRVSAANPNSGVGYELEVIAMVVIGGTVLTGGRGTIIGTVLGVLILRLMRNGIVLIGVPGLAYNIFIGAIILGMMALHSALEKRHNEGL